MFYATSPSTSSFSQQRYARIPSSESRIDSLSDSSVDSDAEKLTSDGLPPPATRAKKWCTAYRWLSDWDNLSRILCLAALTFGVTIFFVGMRWRLGVDRICWDKHTFYSPAVGQQDLSYEEVQFNGSLGFPSPYRGTPEPSVDEAWEGLMDIKLMSLSADEMRDMKLSLDSVRIPEQYGGGYFATLEFPHQIHCLNMLRKSLHHNWDYYEPLSPELRERPQTVQKHLDHCVEMLRQNIMCNVDPGFVSYNWVEGWSKPYPNFNTRHMCRNMDSYLDWARAREVPLPPSTYKWQPMDGEKVWPEFP